MTGTPTTPHAPLRVILVDDSALFRQGLAALLVAAGLEVVAELDNAIPLSDAIRRGDPDVVVLDARMPPTHTDEGIQAALEIRREFPTVGVLILSTYAEGVWANQLFSANSTGLGYLLKDRVSDTGTLIEAIGRVAKGGTVVDSDVIERLVAVANHRSILDELTQREQDVLALMAEGRSNAGIGRSLHVSPRTVEAYIASIFVKLPLTGDDSSTNRRVLAVLAFLEQPGRR